MNYSTLKKTVALSFASLLAVGAVNAQTAKDSTMKSSEATTPKIFGGRAQYRTWNIGVNAGILSPFLAIGGVNNYTDPTLELGYGLSVRKQLGHAFGLQLDLTQGHVASKNENSAGSPISQNGIVSDKTYVPYSATLSGVVNVATADFLRRKNSINFYVSAGAGLVAFDQVITRSSGAIVDLKTTRPSGDTYGKELVIPIGAGVKFRLSDRVALNFGYTANFVDDDSFDGQKLPSEPTHKDKFSYGYGGLEFNLGSSSKPNLDWVNPVALMYDELNDPTLRQEVEALKGRVTNVESAVNDLKKDSDGDGVADQFDKCPNTPAGTVVDGSGCPIKFPVIDTAAIAKAVSEQNAGSRGMGGKGSDRAGAAYSNIQFEFDSSVLRTSSYPILDATSADLRSGRKTIMVNGYASSEGTAAHNLQLSKDRANSVKTYLVNSGVDAKRVKVKGFGETHPIADNSTEDGRVLNRRVEFKK